MLTDVLLGAGNMGDIFPFQIYCIFQFFLWVSIMVVIETNIINYQNTIIGASENIKMKVLNNSTKIM